MSGTFYAAFRFLTELLLAAALYVYPFQRRAGFWWRLPLGVAFCMAASVGLGYMSRSLPALTFLRYIVLFLLVSLLVRFCFALDWRVVLFCTVSAYATQHFAFKVFHFIQEMVPMALGAEFAAYFATMALCYTLVYFLFAKRTRGQDFFHLVREDLLRLCSALILCNIILSMAADQYEGQFDTGLRIIMTGYAILCSLLILSIQYGIFQQGKLQNEMAVLELLLEQEQKQYEMSRDNMELISIKCHDMKHVLTSLEPRISPEEREELSGMIELYDTAVKTGCEVLDVVIAEKSILCQKRQITLTCMADGKKLDHISQSDLYPLFGNAVDNAIEAVSKLPDPERRIVSIVVTSDQGAVTIRVENFFDGELAFQDGLPVTSKEDTDYHGFGMKSIARIAEKYGGGIRCKAAEGVFQLTVLLPLPRKQ